MKLARDHSLNSALDTTVTIQARVFISASTANHADTNTTTHTHLSLPAALPAEPRKLEPCVNVFVHWHHQAANTEQTLPHLHSTNHESKSRVFVVEGLWTTPRCLQVLYRTSQPQGCRTAVRKEGEVTTNRQLAGSARPFRQASCQQWFCKEPRHAPHEPRHHICDAVRRTSTLRWTPLSRRRHSSRMKCICSSALRGSELCLGGDRQHAQTQAGVTVAM